jgi:hypothetical protein
VPRKEPAGGRDWVRFESKIVLDQRHIGFLPPLFSLAETPTVPWRQRERIADLRIAPWQNLVGRQENMAARLRTRLSPSERERQGKQDLRPSI